MDEIVYIRFTLHIYCHQLIKLSAIWLVNQKSISCLSVWYLKRRIIKQSTNYAIWRNLFWWKA